MNEFQAINQYFRQHTSDAILGIGDDAAIVRPNVGYDLHISTDMLVEGTHFFPDTPAQYIGHKTLAVNLSDMAAMGAKPRWALLAVALPTIEKSWVEDFCKGFFTLANQHGLHIIGGDTTKGPLNLSLTIIGEAPQGYALKRQNAQVGDDVWVSGELGLAAAGVAYKLNKLKLPKHLQTICLDKMYCPTPRVQLGLNLLGLARSAIDISDGLLADLGHIAKESQVGMDIQLDQIPSHPDFESDRLTHLSYLVSGGDDYEIAFTAPEQDRRRIEKIASQLDLRLSRIGTVTPHAGFVRLWDKQHHNITPTTKGYDHFD